MRGHLWVLLLLLAVTISAVIAWLRQPAHKEGPVTVRPSVISADPNIPDPATRPGKTDKLTVQPR